MKDPTICSEETTWSLGTKETPLINKDDRYDDSHGDKFGFNRHKDQQSASQYLQEMQSTPHTSDRYDNPHTDKFGPSSYKDQQTANHYLQEIHQAVSSLIDNHAVTHNRVVGLAKEREMDDKECADNSRSTSPEINSLEKSKRKRPIPPDLRFSGNYDENVQSFLNRLTRYADYQRLDNEDKTDLFPLLLNNRSIHWYDGLKPSIKNNWRKLYNECLEKYGPNSRKFHEVGEVYDRKQGKDEKVASYTLDMQNRLAMANIEEPEKTRVYVRNMRSQIRAYVLDHQTNDATFDQSENLARRCEQLELLKETDKISINAYNFQPNSPYATIPNPNQQQLATATKTETQETSKMMYDLVGEIRGMRRDMMKQQLNNSGQRMGRFNNTFQSNTPRTHTGRLRCTTCGGGHYTNMCTQTTYNNQRGPPRSNFNQARFNTSDRRPVQGPQQRIPRDGIYRSPNIEQRQQTFYGPRNTTSGN